MLFSIIVPVFNTDKYLCECIDSVLDQNFYSCEIICINDGSTDESLAILNEYGNKYPAHIKVFSQTNAGLSVTRNKGIEKAKGDFLLFLDSDDKLKEESLSLLAKQLNSNEVDIIAFNSELFYETEKRTEQNNSFNHIENQSFVQGMDYFDAFVSQRGWGPSAVCFYAFRRKLFEKNNLKFEAGLLHEDELFMPQILYYAKVVLALPNILYTYRIHGNSITRTQTIKNFTDKLYITEKLYDFFSSREVFNKFVDRSIFNLTLAGIHGLMFTDNKNIISYKSRQILLNVAHTLKEKLIATLLCMGISWYSFYLKIMKII